MCPDSTKHACTILLLAKKIKFFYSLACKQLAILEVKKIPNFRIKPASLCKGWRGNVFFEKNKSAAAQAARIVEY